MWNNNRIKEIKIIEYDFATPDDHMGKWQNVQFYSGVSFIRKLGPGNSVDGKDALIRAHWYGYD